MNFILNSYIAAYRQLIAVKELITPNPFPVNLNLFTIFLKYNGIHQDIWFMLDSELQINSM